MSKYPWHPSNRPAPANPSLAANIALIGRVGKCLETALEEIMREDDATISATNEGDGDVAAGGCDFESGNKTLASDELSCGEERTCSSTAKKRKRVGSSDGSLGQSKIENVDTTNNKYTTASGIIKMDKSISKSIMEAYGNAVAATNFFEPPSKKLISPATNSNDNNDAITAPAAMLRGEIDYYNRIGDRWRIVLKNAEIKPRKTKIITNGMTGHSLRRRLVLDWGDEKSGKDCQRHVDGERDKKGGDNDDVEAYHFKGTVQILAYDDDI
jgi:hypothetical protein